MTFPTTDAETILLRDVWHALGCAPNPDDFKPTVRAQMRRMALEMIRDHATQQTRIYRENRELTELLRTLRMNVPTEEEA